MLAKSYRRFSGGVIGRQKNQSENSDSAVTDGLKSTRPSRKNKKYDEWDIHHGNLLVPRNSVKYNISIHSFYIYNYNYNFYYLYLYLYLIISIYIY